MQGLPDEPQFDDDQLDEVEELHAKLRRVRRSDPGERVA